jgi:predicted secreted protein
MGTMLYGIPAKLPDGRYFLKVTQDGGDRCVHQVNNVKLATEGNQVTITVPGDVTLFSDIDEQIITQAKESKVLWFGKEIADETVMAAYQKSVNPESELSASLVTIKGEVVTVFYDTQKNRVDVLQSGAVDVLLELSGLVFTKRAFEPVWKVVQGRVKAPQKPKFPREYLFKDDPAAEEEEPEVDL